MFRCVDACHGKYNLGVSPKCGFDSSLGALAGLLLHRIWSVDWGLTVAQYWKKKEKGIVLESHQSFLGVPAGEILKFCH